MPDSTLKYVGDEIRNWTTWRNESILFPYDSELQQWSEVPRVPWAQLRDLRTLLWNRSTFGGNLSF